MTSKSTFNVFVGSDLGLLKGANLVTKVWCNINNVSDSSKDFGIQAMCWGDDEKQIYLALKNGHFCVYDTGTEDFIKNIPCVGGQGKFVGLGHINGTPLTCTESGLLKLWSEESPVELQLGPNVHKMRQNHEHKNLVAAGGNKHQLQLRDLSQPEKVLFKAKNVRHDWLDLEVPIWVTDIAFIPNTQQILTATGYHQIRLYDTATPQRRPVVDFDWGEYPITSMSLVPNTTQMVVGNTHGCMALVDWRKPTHLVHAYKGVAGALKSVQCHPCRPLVASCGLDRHLRVHDLNSRKLLHKFYMKSHLNCMLFARKWPDDGSINKEESQNEEIAMEENDDSSDELWDNIKIVTKGPSKKKLQDDMDELGIHTTKQNRKRKQKSARQDINSTNNKIKEIKMEKAKGQDDIKSNTPVSSKKKKQKKKTKIPVTS